jgi:hypothetical protein
MQPNKKYLNLSPEFWATIKLLSQKLGYTKKKGRKKGEAPIINVPTIAEVLETYNVLNLNTNKLFYNEQVTDFGGLILEYFAYRADLLNNVIQHYFMTLEESKSLFEKLRYLHDYKVPLAFNKQKKGQKIPLFYTSIINFLIERNIGDNSCSYSAGELTAFTQHKFPVRSLSRRVDGSFPRVINPVALWEIKEYYYTTSFGSKVADAVYESMLDGYELKDVRSSLNIDIKHYLMIDGKLTWWVKGRSYLCRLVDAMHMGLITEVLFGKEVIKRIPELTKEWIVFYSQHKDILEQN